MGTYVFPPEGLVHNNHDNNHHIYYQTSSEDNNNHNLNLNLNYQFTTTNRRTTTTKSSPTTASLHRFNLQNWCSYDIGVVTPATTGNQHRTMSFSNTMRTILTRMILLIYTKQHAIGMLNFLFSLDLYSSSSSSSSSFYSLVIYRSLCHTILSLTHALTYYFSLVRYLATHPEDENATDLKRRTRGMQLPRMPGAQGG